MNKLKAGFIIGLSVAISIISSPSVLGMSSAGNENDGNKNRQIAKKKDEITNSLKKSVKHSVKFGGKDCFLVMVPAPETNDHIGIPAPKIDDDIGITGEEYRDSGDP